MHSWVTVKRSWKMYSNQYTRPFIPQTNTCSIQASHCKLKRVDVDFIRGRWHCLMLHLSLAELVISDFLDKMSKFFFFFGLVCGGGMTAPPWPPARVLNKKLTISFLNSHKLHPDFQFEWDESSLLYLSTHSFQSQEDSCLRCRRSKINVS